MKFTAVIFLSLILFPSVVFADQQQDAKDKARHERFKKTFNTPFPTAKEYLSAQYKKTMASLPQDAQKVMRKSQQSWLKQIRLKAEVLAEYDALNESEYHDKNLSIYYMQRAYELEDAIHRVGPFSIVTIHLYKVEKARYSEDKDSITPLAEWKVSFPSIYAPKTPVTEKLNTIFSTVPDSLGDLDNDSGKQLSGHTEIKFASSHIVSVDYGTWAYYSGTPHGNGLGGYRTYFLPSLRLLKENDLFIKDSNWQKVLAEKCIAEGKKRNIDVNEELVRTTIERRVKDVDNWQLNKQGLIINMPFATNEFHPLNEYAEDVQIPWGELKSVLNADTEKWFD